MLISSKMRLNSVCILSLIYCTIDFGNGKNVVVDLENVRSNEFLIVHQYGLHSEARQYFISARDSVYIAGVKHGKLKLTFRGKAKAKKITMYKSHKGILLVIPQGSNWRRSREPADVYYRVEKNKIRKITKREFLYYQHIMTWKTIEIDIHSPGEDVLTRTLGDGSISYTRKDKGAFVLEVRDRSRHIWPDEKDKGGVFVRGIYKRIEKILYFVVVCADIDGKPKTSYFQLAGKRWKRMSDKKGQTLLEKGKLG